MVLFTEEGNYIDSGKVDYICEKYNIKRMLLRICLRKRNKTTNEYQIMYKDEWAKNGSPHKIPSQIIKNKKEKIAILTKDFREKQPRLYALICYHGWHHLLSDLKRTGSANLRTLYAYEFPELNYVYVGLTYNIAIRNQEHNF